MTDRLPLHPVSATSLDTHRTRALLTESLAVTPPRPAGHSRHAIPRPKTLKTIGKPTEWIEPQLSRDDALSEARRIAEEESAFGVGFAWCDLDRWYATDFRPGIASEIVTIEVRKTGATETNEGSRGWRP